MIDVFSRYTWLRPITKKPAKIVTEKVKTIFDVFGCPAIGHCDNGGEFLGDFLKYLKEKRISVIQSSPNHPQSPGKVERMHGTPKLKVPRYEIGDDVNIRRLSNEPF